MNSSKFSNIHYLCRANPVFITRKKHSARTPPREDLLEKALNPKTFNSPSYLGKYLAENVLFRRPGDVLVINKPYGVSSVGYKQQDRGVFPNKRADNKEIEELADNEEDLPQATGSGVTVEQVLPSLSEYFNEPELKFCAGLKRYVTGPVVLPCSKRSFDKIVDSIRFANMISKNKNKKIKDQETEDEEGEDFFYFTMYRALAICVGAPSSSKGMMEGYATFQNVSVDPNKTKNEYIFVQNKKANQSQRTGQYAVPGVVHYDMLDSNHGASVVDLRFTKFARHIPRLVLSNLHSPILGDAIYQRRLVDMDGEPVLIEPKKVNRMSKVRQYAPKDLLRALNFEKPEELNKIPMYFHVYQTILPRYGDPKKKASPDLVASAPLPNYFAAMIKHLGFRDTVIKHLNKIDREMEEPDSEFNQPSSGETVF